MIVGFYWYVSGIARNHKLKCHSKSATAKAPCLPPAYCLGYWVMVHPLMVDIDLVKLVIFPYSVSLLQGILIFHIMLRYWLWWCISIFHGSFTGISSGISSGGSLLHFHELSRSVKQPHLAPQVVQRSRETEKHVLHVLQHNNDSIQWMALSD